MFRYITLCTTILLTAGSVQADIISFTDVDDFTEALPQVVSIVDFDNHTAGTTMASGSIIDGVQFNYNFGGVELKISDVYTTTTAPNFLGTTDFDLLQDGDDFSIDFSAMTAVGISFITADTDIENNDISLTAGGTTVGLDAADIQQTLPDGSNVYFLGLISDGETFTTAAITTAGGGHFFYNVDDIVLAREILLGDVNLDGAVNLLDVDFFINRLSSGTFQFEADCNQDGVVNLLDVDFFIAILGG